MFIEFAPSLDHRPCRITAVGTEPSGFSPDEARTAPGAEGSDLVDESHKPRITSTRGRSAFCACFLAALIGSLHAKSVATFIHKRVVHCLEGVSPFHQPFHQCAR